MSYRRAVARTRQSIYVHRAIGFMNTNAPARWKSHTLLSGQYVWIRVMVELQRALKENAICRSELLIARHSQEDVQAVINPFAEWICVAARIVHNAFAE